MLTFESDYIKAKRKFLDVAEKVSLHHRKGMNQELKVASKKYMIFYKNLTPIVYTEVKESGILLSIRYICEPQQRRGSKETIWEEILKITRNEEDINLAYPTMRVVKDD